MRLITLVFGLLFAVLMASTSLAMPSTDYLPADANLDTSIPSPESVLGFEPGDWRIHHPALVQYMNTLADSSNRVSIKVIGKTYEQRPLLQMIITSEENQGKLEELRQAHLNGATNGDLNAPLVVWLGYSVHGDEASGSNAVSTVAWYLAASQSDYVKELLKNTIVIIDPSLNPDGMDRFASWSNSNSSKTVVGDRNGRVHNQDWPPGRTNHYLFDLNRDWLPLVHPESRARITEYHRWLPHVLTDHHETWHNGFFFQPGVPTRQHPLTTAANLDMTRAIAAYHAESLDNAGIMFFTEDNYDDFYYGKGSTYPDINGSIGILFEQPSARGPVIDRATGSLTFAEAIHNQVRTSLSTLKGAYELSDEFKNYQTEFFAETQARADKAGFEAWVIGDGGDSARAQELMDIFKRHKVEFQALATEINVDGKQFKPGHAWVIPVKQMQFGLAQAMLETRTKFEDNTFYDVSAWSLPMAYNLPFAELSRLPSTTDSSPTAGSMTPEADAVAWVVSWQQMLAPGLLQDLLDADIRVRAATKPFGMTSGPEFSAGSLVVLSGIQEEGKSALALDILQHAAENGIQVHSYNTHQTASGPGLGTSHFEVIKPIKPLLLVGPGVRSYDAGEAWHQMDQRLGVPAVMVETRRLSSIDLRDYTHLIMVSGSYVAINKKMKTRLATWINDGGVLLATQDAAKWAESLCFKSSGCEEESSEKEVAASSGNDDMNYAEYNDQRAQRTIGGAIVSATVDNTHPIAFGFDKAMPIFRRGEVLLKPGKNQFSTPVRYTENPLVSGYIGSARLTEMSNQPAIIAERQGKGLVVRFANNPLFRGFWRGTERLWVNSLYFGPVVNITNLPD